MLLLLLQLLLLLLSLSLQLQLLLARYRLALLLPTPLPLGLVAVVNPPVSRQLIAPAEPFRTPREIARMRPFPSMRPDVSCLVLQTMEPSMAYRTHVRPGPILLAINRYSSSSFLPALLLQRHYL